MIFCNVIFGFKVDVVAILLRHKNVHKKFSSTKLVKTFMKQWNNNTDLLLTPLNNSSIILGIYIINWTFRSCSTYGERTRILFTKQILKKWRLIFIMIPCFLNFIVFKFLMHFCICWKHYILLYNGSEIGNIYIRYDVVIFHGVSRLKKY